MRRRTHAPRASGWAVELAQLTGGPAVAVRRGLRCGTCSARPSVVATDLLADALGVSLAVSGMALASRLDGGTRRPALP